MGHNQKYMGQTPSSLQIQYPTQLFIFQKNQRMLYVKYLVQ